jgi:glycosyltransferase involved in cell wall biosynthesis
VTILTLASLTLDFYELDPRVNRIELQLPTASKNLAGSVWNNFRLTLAIRRTLQRIRPEVALGMMSASAILLAVAGLGLPGRRYGSERTYPPMMPLRAGKGLLRTLSYGLLDGVVCQTNAAADWVSKHTWARCLPVAPNPIVLPLPRQAPEICPGDFLSPKDLCLLAVGRFSEEKQFGHLIETFARLAARLPDWKLIVLGDGTDRATLEAQIAVTCMKDRVFLPGASGNVGDWYARADLFVMTSRFEGFPNVLLEALAHGTPAIAFDCLAGPADIIEHGRNGLLVPAGDFTSLEVALLQVMGDNVLRAALAARAPQVKTRFGRDRVMALWNAALGLPNLEPVQ